MNKEDYKRVKDFFTYDGLPSNEQSSDKNRFYYNELSPLVSKVFSTLTQSEIKEVYFRLIEDGIKVDSMNFSMYMGNHIIEDFFPYFFKDLKWRFFDNFKQGNENKSPSNFKSILYKFTRMGPRNTFFDKVLTSTRPLIEPLEKELKDFEGVYYDILSKRIQELKEENNCF